VYSFVFNATWSAGNVHDRIFEPVVDVDAVTAKEFTAVGKPAVYPGAIPSSPNNPEVVVNVFFGVTNMRYHARGFNPVKDTVVFAI
jgi:hypothetical protein